LPAREWAVSEWGITLALVKRFGRAVRSCFRVVLSGSGSSCLLIWWESLVEDVYVFGVDPQRDDVPVGDNAGGSFPFGNVGNLSEYCSGLEFGDGHLSRIIFDNSHHPF